MPSIADLLHFPLREQLEQVMFENADEEGLVRQPGIVAALARRHPHSIRLVTRTEPGTPRNERFTCHAYALGLHRSEDVRRHWTRLVFPNAEFIDRLIETILVEVTDGATREGDLAVYFVFNRVQHSGRCHGSGIRSKWGFAHIWDHALHEVPLNYGDVVRFFRALPLAEAIAAYVAFARETDPKLRGLCSPHDQAQPRGDSSRCTG